MQKLFTATTSTISIERAEFDRIRTMYGSSVNLAIRQLQQTFFEIYNNHTVLNILNNESFDASSKSLQVYKRAQLKKDRLCLIHGIVNHNNVGLGRDDLFLTANCFLISTDYSTTALFKDYKEIRALRVLEHPFNNIKPFRPTQIDGEVKELSVVSIDIPLLVTQYWMFQKEQHKLESADKKSVKWFLMHYVISPMIRDTLEISFRNRLLKPDSIHGDFDNFLTFFNSYESRLMQSAQSVISDLKTTPRRFSEIADAIPALFNDSYRDAVPLELDQMGNYSYWLECLTLMNWVKPILDIEGLTINHTTDNLHGRLKRVRRYMRMYSVDRFVPDGNIKAWKSNKTELFDRFK